MRRADVPEVMIVEAGDLRAALVAGWGDFRRAPLFGLAISLVLVAGGWLLLWAVAARGQLWWILPAGAGFPLIGPFAAAALHEVSRRIAMGEDLSWGALIAVLLFAAMVPGFAGLLVVLPVLGHASWHLYRRAIGWEDGQS